jgi:hypothetical protein
MLKMHASTRLIMDCPISIVFACKPIWQDMKDHQIIINNPCSHINVELLLVSKMDNTMRIMLCPLVLVVNIDDAATTPISLNGCGGP